MQRLVLRRVSVAALSLVVMAALAVSASADPRLDVRTRTLRAALLCPKHFVHRNHNPVLLVHGTGLNAAQSWSWNYEVALPHAGYDWCAVTLPGQALGDIQVSAEYVVYAIERIHALTGRKLTLITHSQGGMEARWAVRWWRKARADTADLIDLASPNHGILEADACVKTGNCWPAVWQFASGSHFLKALNSVSETPGHVAYTQIYSQTDELVEPSTTAPLRGGANTANIALQSICPGRPVHHAGILTDPVAWDLVLDAMTHPGPAKPARARISPLVCLQPTMPYVNPVSVLAGNAFLYAHAVLAFHQHPGVKSEPKLKLYARRYG